MAGCSAALAASDWANACFRCPTRSGHRAQRPARSEWWRRAVRRKSTTFVNTRGAPVTASSSAELALPTRWGPTRCMNQRRMAARLWPRRRRPDGTWMRRERGQPLHALETRHHQSQRWPSRQGGLGTARLAALRCPHSMVSAGRWMSRRNCPSLALVGPDQTGRRDWRFIT